MRIWITLSLVGVGILWGTPSIAQPIIRITNAKDSLAIRKKLDWYLDYFDIRENVLISITFTNRMPDKIEGITYCINPENPNPYLIIKVRIDNKRSQKQQRIVLAHEMIHVKQYLKGELELIGSKKVMWKGLIFNYSDTNHQFSPWEKEAYRTDNLIAKVCEEQYNQSFLTKNISLDSNGFCPGKEFMEPQYPNGRKQ